MSKIENIEQEAQCWWPLLPTVMLLAIELFFGSGCTVPRTPESTKPNIIFILTDDQDLETLAHMPRVQALLVKQGLTFKNAFVTYSTLLPIPCLNPYRAIRPQPRHPAQQPAPWRFREISGPRTGTLDGRHLAASSRLPHGAVREVSQWLLGPQR